MNGIINILKYLSIFLAVIFITVWGASNYGTDQSFLKCNGRYFKKSIPIETEDSFFIKLTTYKFPVTLWAVNDGVILLEKYGLTAPHFLSFKLKKQGYAYETLGADSNGSTGFYSPLSQYIKLYFTKNEFLGYCEKIER